MTVLLAVDLVGRLFDELSETYGLEGPRDWHCESCWLSPKTHIILTSVSAKHLTGQDIFFVIYTCFYSKGMSLNMLTRVDLVEDELPGRKRMWQ